MDVPEAERVVNDFIDDAQRKALAEYEWALRRIARLGFFRRWLAKRIAQKALGIGPFWDADWAKHPWYVRAWRWFQSIA